MRAGEMGVGIIALAGALAIALAAGCQITGAPSSTGGSSVEATRTAEPTMTVELTGTVEPTVPAEPANGEPSSDKSLERGSGESSEQLTPDAARAYDLGMKRLAEGLPEDALSGFMTAAEAQGEP